MDILEAAGLLQLCAGQDAGCEAEIHGMHSIFTNENTEAVLLAAQTLPLDTKEHVRHS